MQFFEYNIEFLFDSAPQKGMKSPPRPKSPGRKPYSNMHSFSLTNFFRCAVKSSCAKTAMRLLIILNCVIVITDLSLQIQQRGLRLPIFDILHVFFTVCFTLDFAMKIAFHVCIWGWEYLHPRKFLRQPNHLIEISILISSYLLFLWPRLVWRQKPTLFQVAPAFRIVKLFRLSHELKLLYRSIWRTVKHAFPTYLLFAVSLVQFGLAGFYLFRDSVPGMFGTPELAMFRAFAISTKDSWPKAQMQIEEGTGSTTTRWYAVLDIMFLGTIFYNLVVASVTEKVVDTHKKIGEHEQRRRIRAVEKYREQRNRLGRKRAKKVLSRGRDSLEDIPEEVLNATAEKKRDMFRTQKWTHAYKAILQTLSDDYDDYIIQLSKVIETLKESTDVNYGRSSSTPV